MRLPLCVAPVLGLLVAACGGNVVVDSGATGTNPKSDLEICVGGCQALTSLCPQKLPPEGCEASCQKINAPFVAACEEEYRTYITCAASHPEDLCKGSPEDHCADEVAAFMPCSMQVCTANPPTCQ